MRRLHRILRTVALLLVATAIVLGGLLAFNTVTNSSRDKDLIFDPIYSGEPTGSFSSIAISFDMAEFKNIFYFWLLFYSYKNF